MTPLDRHWEALHRAHPDATKTPLPSGAVLITVPGVRLPSGWTNETTTIRFVAPAGYPAARPDCFWADANLALQGNRVPTSSNKTPLPEGGGPPLTWFSWHLQSWDPIRDTLLTYLHVIERRLDPAR